jgi:chromosome segregation and condensation protein ScpB
MAASRADKLRFEKGRALVRALHLSELEAAGTARTLALHEAEKQLDRVARLLPNAMQADISITEIARVTGVSRPTLYELQGRYGGSLADLRLGVLQTIALRQPIASEQLSLLFDGRPEVAHVVVDLANEGLIDFDVEPTPDGDESILTVTPNGYEALERWDFEFEGQEEAAQREGA